MKIFKRSAALFLALTVILAAAAYADFDKSSLAKGIFQIDVVHSVELPSLEDGSYTVWTGAVCFAAGHAPDGSVYLVTDAALAKPDRMYETLSREFLDIFAEAGVEASEENFSELIKIVKTSYYLVYNGSGSLIELSVVSQTASNNILLLQPAEDIDAGVFSYAYADSCEKGDLVHTFSLEGDELDGVVSARQDAYMNNWSLVSHTGEIEICASVDDGAIACTLSDIEPSRANQGSALFDDNGNVIGLNLWSSEHNQLMSLTSMAVMAILDQAGVDYNVVEDEKSVFSLKEAFLFLGIAVFLIIVLLIVLIVLHVKKKQLEEDDLSQLELEASRARAEYARTQSQAQHPKTPSSSRNVSSYNPETAGRVSPSSLPPTRPSGPAAPQITSVMLTVLDGTMKGYSMKVEDKVVFGRDPEACQLVFPAAASAVSRRHCCVSFNKVTGRVLLEDMNSSNGTYFPSGTKLVPGRFYGMRSGDRFYLGLPENLVEIRIQ